MKTLTEQFEDMFDHEEVYCRKEIVSHCTCYVRGRVKDLIQAVKERDDFVIGEEEKKQLIGIVNPEGRTVEVDSNPVNKRLEDQRKRAEESL